MTLDGGGELVSRELAAAIEHAALGFVPVVPNQAALPIEHDQPARQQGGRQKDEPIEQLTHHAMSCGAQSVDRAGIGNQRPSLRRRADRFNDPVRVNKKCAR